MDRIPVVTASTMPRVVMAILRSDGGMLLLLFLVEAAIFAFAANVNVAWIYPRFNDQIQYLTEAYLDFEFYRQNGAVAGFWQALSHPKAQGSLHDFLALIIFAVAGAGRVAALVVNLIAFALWQFMTFAAIRQSGFSRNVAWFGVALLLCLKGPWLADSQGSAFDFRLDHMAMCWMGVTIMAAARSDGFVSRKWSLLFGLFAGITLLTRFLTAAYFVLILVLLVGAYARAENYPARLKNLVLAACVALLVAVPIFALNFDTIYNYYVVGHLTGVESGIRDAGKSVPEKFLFVAGAGARYQGFIFLAVILAIPLIDYLVRRKEAAGSDGVRILASVWNRETNWWTIGLIFLLAPAIILSLHKQVSGTVLSILAPGAFLAAMSLLAPILAAWERKVVTLRHARGVTVILLATLALGMGNFAVRSLMSPTTEEFKSESRQLNRVAELLHDRIVSLGLREPKIASDQITDFLDAQVFRVILYERKKVWVPLVMTLPSGIAEADKQLLFDRLSQSDFVFLTDYNSSAGEWPYDRQMRALYPELRRYCESQLALIGKYHFYGKVVSLYAKPSPAPGG